MYETRELFGKQVRVQIPSEVFPTDEQIHEMDGITGANCHHGWYESTTSEALTKGSKGDPVNLHYRYWLPPGGSGSDQQPPKGIVVYTHGILSQTAHACRIDGRPLDTSLVVDTFTAKGMVVYARDQYGHGLSEGTRFYVPSWKEARDDLINFVKLVATKHPTTIPLFLSGESFGGCLTIHTAKHFQDHPDEAPPNFDSSLLICPAIKGDLPPFPILQILRYVLAPIAPTWTPFFMPSTITPQRIWRDPKVLEYYQDPKKLEMGLDACGEPFRLGTAVNVLAAMEEVNAIVPDFATPFCIVHGDADVGVPITGSELLFEQSSTPSGVKEFHAISEACHGVLADPKAEDAMHHLSGFVDSRMQTFVAPPPHE